MTEKRRTELRGSRRIWGLIEVENLSGVSELRETVCTRLELWRENLCQVSVAWPRSFRIQVDRQSDMARNRARMTLQAICLVRPLGSLEGRNASVESNGESLGPMYEGTVARLLVIVRSEARTGQSRHAIKAESDPKRPSSQARRAVLQWDQAMSSGRNSLRQTRGQLPSLHPACFDQAMGAR